MDYDNGIDRIDSGVSRAYDVLENADGVEGYQQISPDDRDRFDFSVSIDGTEYGVNVAEGQAGIMQELNQYDDTVVNGTRATRGTASGDVLTPSTETMTVQEAVAALDSRDPSEFRAPGTDMEPQERNVEESPTAGRYGKRKVAEEGNWG